MHRSGCSDPHHPCFLFVLRESRLGFSENNSKRPPVGISLLRDDEITVLMRLPFLSDDFTSLTNTVDLKLVGSRNGLVCCFLLKGIEIDEECNLVFQVFKQLIVWNPATQQFRFLPKPNNITSLDKDADDVLHYDDCSLRTCPLIGFDFVEDHNITAYKLVRIFDHVSEDPNKHGEVVTTFRAQVFVRSTNSWRQAENELGFPSCNCSATSRITLNGLLYWMVRQRAGGDNCLLSFNLREEVFDVIDLPMDLRYEKPCILYSWRNSPAIVVLDSTDNYDVNVMFWVMNTDQGSKRSFDESGEQLQNLAWTPQLRLKHSVIQEITFLLGSWKDQLLFARDKSDEVVDAKAGNIVPQDLIVYDPKSETKKEDQVS